MTYPTQPTEGAALVAPDELGLERLQRTPIIDRIDQRTLELMRRTIAVAEGDQAITNAEMGHFLELCAHYGLDPFAREAWIAKSKTGKLLIMVGRDGLRKVVVRNGLEMRGATIYTKDEFTAEYIDNPEDAKPGEWESHGSAPFTRVTHKRTGIGEARGRVAGAWARVFERGTRIERGYFDAPLSEYVPANVSQYSPWSKQVSTMMLGAVERQAARQATPLGGLLVEGEDESARAAAVGTGHGSGESVGWKGFTVEQAALAEGLLKRADTLGHAGISKRSVMEQKMNGQAPPDIDRLIAAATAELDALEAEIKAKAEPIEDADVVPDAAPESDDDRAVRLEREALDLLSSADGVEESDPDRAEELRAEAAAKHDLAVAAGDPDQTTLPEM